MGFGQEIEAAKAFLGDVSSILTKVDGLKQKYFVDQIGKAKDADAARDAYQAFLDAAAEAGWDVDAVSMVYADRRLTLLQNETAGSGSVSDKMSKIRDVANELRDLGLVQEKIGKRDQKGGDLIRLDRKSTRLNSSHT